MGNRLDDLLLCDLYQVHGERGYIEIKGLYLFKRRGIDSLFDDLSDVSKICSVIVKKNILFNYNLKEIITGISLDTLYEEPGYMNITHFVRENKKEYDTFILVPYPKNTLTVEILEKYINDHKDVKSYRAELERLLRSGSVNHYNKERPKDISDDEKVEKLLRDLKKRR